MPEPRDITAGARPLTAARARAAADAVAPRTGSERSLEGEIPEGAEVPEATDHADATALESRSGR